ncbi:tail assembly protein [Pseudomonas sp. PDM03]|uniref:tail assembly protein n=1 Tax=Pseudomonas sp. PDM03 TaxID=2769266 RepID=UPI001784E8AD|nr:tail assembly protein [Pseudomonas sp. PDM03]MBD9585836.1 tail assembly protein [Pseudomonas sp. PDM03]
MSAAYALPMTTILLSGSLAQAFGRKHVRHLETGTAAEAFRALKHTVQGFEEFIRDSARRGLRYAIFRNRENVGEAEFTLSGTTEIRIVPIISGSKNGGLFQAVLGVVLIVVGAFITPISGPIGGALVSVGIGMAIGGVVQMLTPVPKTPSQQEQSGTENKPSYLFNGAFNSTQQGLPVPVVYGHMLVGSSVVAIGTWAEAIPV